MMCSFPNDLTFPEKEKKWVSTVRICCRISCLRNVPQNHTEIYHSAKSNVVGLHRLDADPEPTSCFDADPAPSPDPTRSLMKVENETQYFDFSSHYIVFSFSAASYSRFHHFHYFGQYIEDFWKKYCLAVHLVQMDTYQDQQALDASIWIRQNDDEPTGSGSTTPA
jgi:hypothetical protein